MCCHGNAGEPFLAVSYNYQNGRVLSPCAYEASQMHARWPAQTEGWGLSRWMVLVEDHQILASHTASIDQHDSSCITYIPTWSRSSKSRAASFVRPDTLSLNLRMVSRPNVGTRRYLYYVGHTNIWEKMTYRSLRSCTALPPYEYKIRRRWVRVAFHTPNSNSCIKSGTSIEWKSKPNLASFSEKAF